MPYKDASVRKAKQAESSRKYYLANKKKAIAANNAYRRQKREDWQIFKGTLKCSKCGYSHPAALDFHHTDPGTKEGNVYRYASSGQYKKAFEEVEKCIVLCANCHRVHHYEEKLIQSSQSLPQTARTNAY
jgi:hypothetical protein